MQPTGPSVFESLLPILVTGVIFYFMFMRPQGKKLKDHEKFLSDLKRGDEVITNSGILGTVDGMSEQIVTLEIASGVKIKMLKKQIAGAQKAALNALPSNATPVKSN